MTTKHGAEKFLRENDFELWKLKLWTKVIVNEQRLWRGSRVSTVALNNGDEENTDNNFELGNPLVHHWKWRKTNQ